MLLSWGQEYVKHGIYFVVVLFSFLPTSLVYTFSFLLFVFPSHSASFSLFPIGFFFSLNLVPFLLSSLPVFIQLKIYLFLKLLMYLSVHYFSLSFFFFFHPSISPSFSFPAPYPSCHHPFFTLSSSLFLSLFPSISFSLPLSLFHIPSYCTIIPSS